MKRITMEIPKYLKKKENLLEILLARNGTWFFIFLSAHFTNKFEIQYFVHNNEKCEVYARLIDFKCFNLKKGLFYVVYSFS